MLPNMTTSNIEQQRRLVPAPKAFEAMGISRTTGYAGIHDGTLPIEAIRVGGQWKFRSADLSRLLDGPQND
jgi:excisionase family DNA binding protein